MIRNITRFSDIRYPELDVQGKHLDIEYGRRVNVVPALAIIREGCPTWDGSRFRWTINEREYGFDTQDGGRVYLPATKPILADMVYDYIVSGIKIQAGEDYVFHISKSLTDALRVIKPFKYGPNYEYSLYRKEWNINREY